jgi:hypothetical protein
MLPGLQGLGQHNKTYKVNPGEQVIYGLPVEVRYYYPEFRTGLVQFRNGNLGGGKMNYSPLLDEMEFISDSGDTLALADVESIKYIHFGTDTFFVFQNFLIKELAITKNVRLCERRSVSLVNRERFGGHGELKSGSVLAVEQLSSGVNTMRKMVAKEMLTFSADRTYYFGDQYGSFKLASKKNLTDMFGKNYPGLENFLRTNDINYLKEEDLRLVLEFLAIDEQKNR